MFAKAVLCSPPRGGKSKRCAVKTILNTRLLRWKKGDLCGLWQEAKAEARPRKVLSVQHSNSIQALRLAKEGRYGDAMRSLSSQGCASHDNEDALTDLQRRHPDHVLPTWCEELPPPLVADSSTVLSCLQAFPRGSSPGFSQLRAQHLLDAIKGTNVPVATTCLDNLTKLMNFLLSRKADRRIALWLLGAQLTAIHKSSGGFRPITVGDTLRRLASRICCLFAKPHLPELFLPYGQVGVGIKGGLESVVHTVRTVIDRHSRSEDFCCFKVDMTNVFNECSRTTFLKRLVKEFPELMAWVQWSYHTKEN